MRTGPRQYARRLCLVMLMGVSVTGCDRSPEVEKAEIGDVDQSLYPDADVGTYTLPERVVTTTDPETGDVLGSVTVPAWVVPVPERTVVRELDSGLVFEIDPTAVIFSQSITRTDVAIYRHYTLDAERIHEDRGWTLDHEETYDLGENFFVVERHYGDEKTVFYVGRKDSDSDYGLIFLRNSPDTRDNDEFLETLRGMIEELPALN